jgi:hypothetical protein
MKAYHEVPRKLVDDQKLMPLNVLKDRFPEAYAAAHKKYEASETQQDRAWLTRRKIPPLDYCRWNDVIHLTLVPPDVLLREHAALGHPFRAEYFEIETRDLVQAQCAIFRYIRAPRAEDREFPDSELIRFTEEAGARLAVFTNEQRMEWRMRTGRGQRLMRYEFIPHLLYRGEISIEHCPRVTVGEG